MLLLIRLQSFILQNTTIDVNYVVDHTDISENLISVEFVLENMQESDSLCDSKRQVGNFYYFNIQSNEYC